MTFKRIASCLLLAGCLVSAGCTKDEHTATAKTAVDPVAEPTPSQLERMVVRSFRVDPVTIRRDQSVTATVSVAGAPAGTLLTLAWFGPDGWLALDQQERVNGSSVSFSIPAATFVNPGVYHGSLDAGAVHLGDAALTVSG